VEGRQLGSYRIASRLGGGGMGEVYRAYDDRLRRDVAIKVLHPSSADDDVVRGLLLREARAAAAVNHDLKAQDIVITPEGRAKVLCDSHMKMRYAHVRLAYEPF
jgi:serine/threonine protein kinase